MTLFNRYIYLLMILFAASFSLPLSAAVQDEGYARFLYSSGYYDEAANTFLFLHYSASDSAHKNYYLYWLGKAKYGKKDYPAAENVFRRLSAEKDIFSVKKEDIYLDYMLSLYFQKKFYEASFEIENGTFSKESGKFSELDGWCAVNTADWGKAASIFEQLSFHSDEYDPQRIRMIVDILNNRNSYQPSSPLFAGVLSALLPGAGQLYAGNMSNAFGAFLVNAVFGSLTAYSCYKKEWVYAAFFGAVETGWYTGNIVSAYQEAGLKNKKEDNDCKLSLSVHFPFGTR